MGVLCVELFVCIVMHVVLGVVLVGVFVSLCVGVVYLCLVCILLLFLVLCSGLSVIFVCLCPI